MLYDVRNKKVLITGSTGFLGKRMSSQIQSQGGLVIELSSRICDLRNQEMTMQFFQDVRPEIVVHCAVQGGGIGWMKDHPVESGLDNYRININILESSFRSGVQAFIGVSSACVYPKKGCIPYEETSVWGGYPEPANGPYALSKRAMMDLGRAFAQQYGFQCTFPILANLYGPGDHLTSERAHVVADLMLRARKSSTLTVWGTGTAEREFIHVDDAVEGILSTLGGSAGGFYNVGTGISTPIRDLALLIAKTVHPNMTISFDKSKPDGQLVKVMNVDKVFRECGWKSQISLDNGIKETWNWYQTIEGQ